MENFTNENSLSDIENQIILFVQQKNKRYKKAFICTHKFYKINQKLNKSNHYLVFKAIYIDKLKLPAWKLATRCNIAESTLFRLRNEILDCFNTCLQTIIQEEVAATKDKL